MPAVSAPALLDIWDRGQSQGPVERALALLAAACPQASIDQPAKLSIGRRDSHLLALREQAFGSQMASVMACPQCGERLELSFSAADLRVDSRSADDLPEPLMTDGYEVRVRLPNSLDLLAAGELSNVSLRRRLLLERCLITAIHHGEPVSANQLPSNVFDALEERMAQADLQADVTLEITCPACDHRWQSIFDIVSFFWSEIEAWATRSLHEVHILASAYGWHEREILALSPWRRQFYLERVGG
jgi:hypothetical protein